ncbi:MAG: MurR/RpiR family transcriptional regulator [Clostridium sp.]
MITIDTIFQIKEGREKFTGTEKKIADFILEYKDEVIILSAQELGEKVESSAAAVVRFSKKLGYKGFTELKMQLAKSDNNKVYEDFNEIIKESDSIEAMVDKTKNSTVNTIEQTYRLINMRALKGAIDGINNAKHTYLYGVGASGLVALDLQYKLSRIKKSCIYQIDSNIQLASAVHISSEDVAFGISYSGETKEIVLALKRAKENGATTIAITKNTNNTLSKVADYTLYVPNEEKELRLGAMSSRLAELTLTDLIYLGVVKGEYNNSLKYIEDTRDIIQKIK